MKIPEKSNIAKIISNLFRTIKGTATRESKLLNFSHEQLFQKLTTDSNFLDLYNNYINSDDPLDDIIVITPEDTIRLDNIKITNKRLAANMYKTKKCLKCERVLPIDMFNKAGKNKRGHHDGRHEYCKDCTKYMLKSPKLTLASIYRYLEKKGIDLKFTRDEFFDKFLKEDSPYMVLHKKWDRKDKEKTPRIELIDKSKGYVLDNIKFTTMEKMKEEAKQSNTKQCIICKRYLTKDKFGINKKTKDGYSTDCLECRSNIARGKDRLAWGMYSGQVKRSIKRGHHLPTYTKEELQSWLEKQPNYDKLYEEWVNSGYDQNKKPSVDRILNNFGYRFDNIRLTTWEENNKAEHKPMVILNLDGELIKKFDTLTEASEYIGIGIKTISKNMRNAKWVMNDNIVLYLKDASKEFIKKIVNEIKSGEYHKRLNKQRYKPVYAYDEDGVFIKEYSSASEAAKELLKDESKAVNVTQVCNGSSANAGNHLFIYKEDYTPDLFRNRYSIFKNKKRAKKVIHRDLDGEMHTYNSIADTIKNTGIGEKAIVNAIRSKDHTTRSGHKFKLAENNTILFD